MNRTLQNTPQRNIEDTGEYVLFYKIVKVMIIVMI